MSYPIKFSGRRSLPGDPEYVYLHESPEEFGERVAREGFERFFAPIFDELEQALRERYQTQRS